jgi:hypothetical protein
VSIEAWLAGIAVALSVGTTLSQLSLSRRSYLACELSVEYPRPGIANLRVSIANASARAKKVGPVFLLMGPVAENPITTFNALAAPGSQPVACCAIDFERFGLQVAVDPALPLRRLVPLTYFTEENDTIGDEVLRFTYPLALPASTHETAMSVRLYVYGHRLFRQRLHRKVQEVVLLGAQAPGTAIDFGLAAAETPACRAACRRLAGCTLAAGRLARVGLIRRAASSAGD